MPKTQSKKSTSKTLPIVLVILLVIAIACIVFLLVNKQENTDYTNPQTYIGLTEAEAVERAKKSGLEYALFDQDYQGEEARGVTGTVELILYESGGKIVDAEEF